MKEEKKEIQSKIRVFLKNGISFDIIEEFELTKNEVENPERVAVGDWYCYTDTSGKEWFVRVSDITAIAELERLK